MKSKAFKTAFFVVLTQLLQMTMGIVDTWMVGHVGPAAIGGVGAASGIFTAIMLAGMGILFSLDTHISHSLGARQEARARAYLSQGLWLSGVLSIPLALIVVGVAFIYPLIGATQDLVDVVVPFLKVIALSMPGILFFLSYQRFWMAHEKVIPAFLIIFFANILNIIGNLILVPRMGAVGTAYSSLFCRLTSALAFGAYTFYALRNQGVTHSKLPTLSKKLQKRIVELGLPIAGQITLEVGAFTIASTLATRLGAIASATNAIVLMVASFTFMIPLAIAQTCTVRVGNAMGAKNYELAKKTGYLAIIQAAVIMALSGICIFMLSDKITSLFTPEKSVQDAARQVFLIAALFQVFDGIQVTATGALRGIGVSKASMICNLIGHYPVGLTLGFILCFYFNLGLMGLWTGLATGLAVVSILLTGVWVSKTRNLKDNLG